MVKMDKSMFRDCLLAALKPLLSWPMTPHQEVISKLGPLEVPMIKSPTHFGGDWRLGYSEKKIARSQGSHSNLKETAY